MTELEVAAALGKSRGAVRRLRLTGRLAYLRLRPVLIDRTDLAEYVAAEQARATKKAEAAARAARRYSDLSPEEKDEAARVWALSMRLRAMFPRDRRRTPAEMAEWRKHPR